MRREDVGLLDWCGYKVREVRIPIEVGNNATIYKAHEGAPWDYIAWACYNDEENWYIIADVNGIIDPFVFPGSGEAVVIPRLR